MCHFWSYVIKHFVFEIKIWKMGIKSNSRHQTSLNIVVI